MKEILESIFCCFLKEFEKFQFFISILLKQNKIKIKNIFLLFKLGTKPVYINLLG
jgi:hypothetical protein